MKPFAWHRFRVVRRLGVDGNVRVQDAATCLRRCSRVESHRVDDQRSVSMFKCSFPVRAARQILVFSICSDVVVDMVVSFSSLPLGVERQALHLPSPAASSTTASGTSEEEGLHTALFLTLSRWPSTSSPGTSEEEGLAPLPSSSHCRWVLRRRRDRPSSSQSQRVLPRRKNRPSSSHRRCVLHAYGRG